MTIPSVLAAQLQDIAEIRRLLDEAYDHYFKYSDGHSKMGEGLVRVDFGTYFDRAAGGEPLEIRGVGVFSYVLGPERMHDFNSTAEALAAVRQWHAEEMARDYNEEDRILPVEKILNAQRDEESAGD